MVRCYLILVFCTQFQDFPLSFQFTWTSLRTSLLLTNQKWPILFLYLSKWNYHVHVVSIHLQNFMIKVLTITFRCCWVKPEIVKFIVLWSRAYVQLDLPSNRFPIQRANNLFFQKNPRKRRLMTTSINDTSRVPPVLFHRRVRSNPNLRRKKNHSKWF